MKKIQVLGPGCASCEGLASDVKTIVAEIDLDCEIEKVTDINEIVSSGVMITPALVVDGQVKVAGRRPSLDELREMLA
jgi:small redox-active disulfide protein 2